MIFWKMKTKSFFKRPHGKTLKQISGSSRSIAGPLLLSVYINGLSDYLVSNTKLFANYATLFSVIKNANSSTKYLKNDLAMISNWSFKWQLNLNLDPANQAKEVLFSRKT